MFRSIFTPQPSNEKDTRQPCPMHMLSMKMLQCRLLEFLLEGGGEAIFFGKIDRVIPNFLHNGIASGNSFFSAFVQNVIVFQR